MCRPQFKKIDLVALARVLAWFLAKMIDHFD